MSLTVRSLLAFALSASSLLVSDLVESPLVLAQTVEDEESIVVGSGGVAVDAVPLLRSPAPERESVVAPEGVFAGGAGGPLEEAGVAVRVEELVEARSAASDAWLMSDGSLQVESYAVPRYFQSDRSSEWLKIDTTLVPDVESEGRFRSNANDWIGRSAKLVLLMACSR